jgi:hypothetical protein
LKVATVNPEVATGGIKTTNGNRTMANGDVSSPALPQTIHARAIAIMTSASAPKTVKGLKVATVNPEVATGGIKTTNGNRTMANGDVSSPALPRVHSENPVASGDVSSPALPRTIHARAIAITTSASAPKTVKGSKAAISPAPIVSDRATTAPDLATTEDIATPAHHQIMIAHAIVTTTSAIAPKTVKELKVATVNPEVATGGIKTTNGNRTMANGDVSSPALLPIIHARVIATTISASVLRTAKRSYPAILKALKSTFRYWNFLLVCLYIGIICKDPK